ncbi:hypothetical protein O6H91_03G030600 [Diphasiastrum complanatum]|nr:hypothetical protein O6H91_03G030600 [Diphasiastrum complanatum]
MLGSSSSILAASTALVSPSSTLPNSLAPENSCQEIIETEKNVGTSGANICKGRKQCRSRQLRTKACQIWADYLRPLASAEGITVRFCDNKEVCISEMEKGGHALCTTKRKQLKWPENISFVHPKDLTSKELQVFINAYEQGRHQCHLKNCGQPSGSSAITCGLRRVPKRDVDPCKVSTKELRYWLRENDKPIFCIHPKAANQFVNMGKLATMILRSGGKCRFEEANGWDAFVTSCEGMNKPTLSSMERRKCICTIKRLYNKYLMEFVQETLKELGLENDGDMALAEVPEGLSNEDEHYGDDVGHGDANSGADHGLCRAYMGVNHPDGTAAPSTLESSACLQSETETTKHI